MLEQLRMKLSPAERNHRETAFKQAAEFIDRAARAGGVTVHKRSYPVPPRADGRRVDIEVLSGEAFVDPQESKGT